VNAYAVRAAMPQQRAHPFSQRSIRARQRILPENAAHDPADCLNSR
jgi:hypothetical protein